MKHLIAFALVAFSGCALTDPSKPPRLQAENLPALHLDGLDPATVDLTVETTRSLALQKGTAPAVSDAVRDAFLSSLERGGMKVDRMSPNKLHLTVADCEGVDPKIQCVSMKAALKTLRNQLEVSAQGSHGMGEGKSAIGGFGNLDYAYEMSLQGVIQGLPRQLKKMR